MINCSRIDFPGPSSVGSSRGRKVGARRAEFGMDAGRQRGRITVLGDTFLDLQLQLGHPLEQLFAARPPT